MPTPAPAPTPTTRPWLAYVTVAALGSLPYVSLFAANVGEVLEIGRVLAWWAVTLAVGVGAVAVAARFSPRSAGWTGVVVGAAIHLFFNFPAVTGLRESLDVSMADVTWWAAVSAGVLAVVVVAARARAVQLFLGIAAPALLLLPVSQLVVSTAAADPSDQVPDTAELPALAHTPNVYWFVLDGQAGPPFLRERIGMDPDPFIDHLQRRGFDVLEQATSNYPFTHLAVASALEQQYLYEGVAEPAAGPYFERLRGDNRTVDTFRANGYGYAHAYPGLWTGSRCAGLEDVCFGDHGPLSDTEWALASATPLIEVLADDEANEDIARTNDPLEVTDLVLSAGLQRPYFAMIHVINPHPPYLRDADCDVRDVPLSFAAWGNGAEYGEAVTCLFDRLSAAVDRILAADDDPVIIIQGDHGPRLGLSAETSGEVLLDDPMYFSALSAIRLPEPCADLDVADDLTLVNTFRVVFACLEDRPPDLLPDRAYPILRDYG